MPLSPFYGNVNVVDAYEQAKARNQAAEMQQLQGYGALQKILHEQQALRMAAEEAKRKAALGQPIGAGGLLKPSGEIIPPAAKPTGPKEFAPPELLVLTDRLAKLPAGDPSRPYVEARIKYLTERANADNPAPVTPTTIADPANPNETLVVDARTKKVIGKGPKLTQVGGQERQLELDMPKAKERVDIMTQNLDRMETAIGELEKMPGLSRITGTLMGRTPNISNDATTAQAKLDSIRSQIFVSALQSMREASKTGGAVGNVSDREGDKMERTIAALDQAQRTPAFKAELKKAKEQLRTSKAIIKRAFEDQFRGVQPRNAPPQVEDPLGLRK